MCIEEFTDTLTTNVRKKKAHTFWGIRTVKKLKCKEMLLLHLYRVYK